MADGGGEPWCSCQTCRRDLSGGADRPSCTYARLTGQGGRGIQEEARAEHEEEWAVFLGPGH